MLQFWLLWTLIGWATASLFAPFNWAADTEGYIIKGQYCQKGGTCENVTLVVDTPNQRLYIDAGGQGGINIVTSTGVYIYGFTEFAQGLCFNVPGSNYSTEVQGYTTLGSQPGSGTLLSRYFGFLQDATGCGLNLAGTIITAETIIIEYDFAQLFPFDGFCVLSQGTLVYDLLTLDRTAPREPYFVLPPSCSPPQGPVNWCQTFFPPGNACS